MNVDAEKVITLLRERLSNREYEAVLLQAQVEVLQQRVNDLEALQYETPQVD